MLLLYAVIFANASFLMIVGDEHGLTDGVLLAEMVLLLKKGYEMDLNESEGMLPDI